MQEMRVPKQIDWFNTLVSDYDYVTNDDWKGLILMTNSINTTKSTSRSTYYFRQSGFGETRERSGKFKTHKGGVKRRHSIDVL
jgi:hypothetical protein